MLLFIAGLIGSRTISFDYLDKISLKLNMKPLNQINPKLKISTKTKIYIESKNSKYQYIRVIN